MDPEVELVAVNTDEEAHRGLSAFLHPSWQGRQPQVRPQSCGMLASVSENQRQALRILTCALT
jgi:hypothetical protein